MKLQSFPSSKNDLACLAVLSVTNINTLVYMNCHGSPHRSEKQDYQLAGENGCYPKTKIKLLMVNFPHQTVIPWLINSQVTSKQSFLHYFDVKTESLKIGMQKGWAIFKCLPYQMILALKEFWLSSTINYQQINMVE